MNINELARGSAQARASLLLPLTKQLTEFVHNVDGVFAAADLDEPHTIHCDGISEQLAEHITKWCKHNTLNLCSFKTKLSNYSKWHLNNLFLNIEHRSDYAFCRPKFPSTVHSVQNSNNI